MKYFYRFIWLLLVPASAQVYAAAAAGSMQYHEVTGGINMLRSSLAPLSNSEIRGGMGLGAGAGYAYHFNQQMSLRTGLEVNSYSGTSYVNVINESSIVTIPTNEWSWWEVEKWFEFQSQVKNYSVRQSSLYLQIPLLFGYEDAMPWMDWITWYAHGGFKLGYSLFGSSYAMVDSIIRVGDFPQADVIMGGPDNDETTQQDPEKEDAAGLKKLLGLGSYGKHPQQASPNFGFSSVCYLEIGLKQKLVQQHNLYVGIFGEYSLYSAVASSKNKNMYEYNPLPQNNEFYQIQYTPASHTATSQSRTFYPMAFGITLRFSFDTKRPEPSNNRMLQMRYLDF